MLCSLTEITYNQDFRYICMCKSGFKMCKSKVKLHNIIQQLKAVGHQLLMVVTMLEAPCYIGNVGQLCHSH